MNFKFIAGIALACLAFTACDDSTDTIGSSLIENNNGVSIETASFSVASSSVAADSVLSRSTYGYLGKVRDPETGAYITGDFMAQYNNIEGFYFPKLDSLVTYDSNGNEVFGSAGTIKADSCELRLFFEDKYGDAKQSMKLTAYEMAKAMNEDRYYYSTFDPYAQGYVREDGIHKDKVYNLTDYNVAQSTRDTSIYVPYITVQINDAYTDKDGKTYNNFGAYMLQKYYDDASNYKNAYTFRNNVVPGFFFKLKSGLGNMVKITDSQLNVYFKMRAKKAYTDNTSGTSVTAYKDTIYNQVATFWGTEEVLQHTTFSNDEGINDKLVADESCTYLKTPSGIFTELTLPVDSIMMGHENDTIASARVVLERLNNTTQSTYAFDVPQTLLMVPKDSLRSFFEEGKLYDNKTTYVATWGGASSTTSTDNTYTFYNIGKLITSMYRSSNKTGNWNKVVLVPVTVSSTTTQSSYGTTSTIITKVNHDMSLTSTRLVKGTSSNGAIRINVIYSKFK